MNGLVNNQKEEAPIYFGGKSDEFPFIDDQYDRKRDDFDDCVMDALVAIGIDDNYCPTSGEWVHFCIVNAISALVTGDTLIVVPKKFSPGNMEELSWGKLWHLYDTGKLKKEHKNEHFDKKFTDSLMRLFILRHHTVDGPDNPYNQSYFVKRWGFSFNLFPDTLNSNVCNVRLCHLRRGREIFRALPEMIQENIQRIEKFLPLILKEVNVAIKA